MNIETQHIPRRHIGAAGAVYLVQAKHSQPGNVVRESHATIRAAVARGVELVQAGYSVDICSPAFVRSAEDFRSVWTRGSGELQF